MNFEIKRNHLVAAATFGAALLFANLSTSPAMAAGIGLGLGANVGVGANAGAGNLDARTDANISANGAVNGNGVDARDRDTGQARAEDRRSAEGALHNKAKDKLHGDVDTDMDSSASLATHAGR